LLVLCWGCDPAGDNSIDKADIKRLKESGVFGPLSFWVTEIKNLEELGNPNAGVSTAAARQPGSVLLRVAVAIGRILDIMNIQQ
jgi:hypothetical protein